MGWFVFSAVQEAALDSYRSCLVCVCVILEAPRERQQFYVSKYVNKLSVKLRETFLYIFSRVYNPFSQLS